MRTYYDESDVRREIERLAGKIQAEFSPDRPLNVVGIRTRGETLAQRLVSILQSRGFTQIGRGVLDITLYRDDFQDIGNASMVRPTEMDFHMDDRPLLLVDDVLFTGRSIRAALNALIDFGRPSVIRLAVLVDRNGRELPIGADFVGITMRDVPQDHRVNVHFVETDGKDEILVEPVTE